MYFLCFTAYFTTPFAKYPEHFNQPLTEMASGPQFTTVEFGSLLPSHSCLQKQVHPANLL